MRIIDLFSGAGGLTLGFVDDRFDGRFESVMAVDNDAASIATYSRNFGEHGVCADIEDLVKSGAFPPADVVIGGPPCQGFSLLNKNRRGDVRRALWEPFLDVVQQSKARCFVIENVRWLATAPELDDIQRRARALGFKTHVAVLNAADYGVPQARYRAVVVGTKTGAVRPIEFPPMPTHRAPGELGNLPTWRTVRDAIADLPAPRGTEIRDEAPPLDLHFGRSPTAVSMERYKAVPPGGNRFDLERNAPDITPECWKRKKTGSTDLFGRLWWDRPSVTIRTEFYKPEKGRYLHPVKHRPITHREAARLMSFPDDFKFCGSKIEIARQIGNAVPPLLAAAIAEVVGNALEQADSKAA